MKAKIADVCKLLLLWLCCCGAASAANFALVQHTNGSGSLTQAFTSANGAGNCIIVKVYLFSGAPTVSDSQGNSYTRLSHGSLIDIWASVGVKAGSNTVTVSTGAGGAYAEEYSSAASPYYVCRAFPGAGYVANNGSGYTTFTSGSEVMVSFAATTTGSATPYSSTSGTFTLNGTMPFDFTTSVAAGWDDQSSMTGTYTNTISYAGGPGPTAGDREGVFINLTNSSCLGASGGHFSGFSIVY